MEGDHPRSVPSARAQAEAVTRPLAGWPAESVSADPAPRTLEPHTASSTGPSEPSREERRALADLFKRHMAPRRGRADRKRPSRAGQVVITVKRGEPAVMVTQSGKHWRVAITVPSGWWENVYLPGRATRPATIGWPHAEVDAGRLDLVLAIETVRVGGVEHERVCFLHRPHARRNEWRVLFRDRPLP